MNQHYDIQPILEKLGIDRDDCIPFGYDKAKIDSFSLSKRRERKGKLILCTAMTPNKAGEGKTTTAIGLADGLSYLNKNAVLALREPSLGPVFGVKGGGTGGGEAVVEPEDDINLHFTGDIHAITSVNNLIAALVDNELYQHNIDIDPDRIIFPRAIDMNDRSLRSMTVALNDKKALPHHSSFVITAASEVMAIFCLCKDEEDFLNRVESILVAYTKDDKPVYVRDLHSRTAIKKLIHTALYPNLVQSRYHTPAFVHGGPFANIAHGTNSIIATDTALRFGDYVVTEAGFGSDLGMEKYLDIVSPLQDKAPDLIVMVTSARSLKLHGGVAYADMKEENVEAVKKGFSNLLKHVSNVSLYHLPCLVSINHFDSDTENETNAIIELLKENNIPYALNSSYTDGPKGCVELAKKVIDILSLEKKEQFAPIVDASMTMKEKIEKIATEIYGSTSVEYSSHSEEQLKEIMKLPVSDFSVCMSKVPNSLSDDPHLINVPHVPLHIKEYRVFTGAKFIVPLTGDIFTMPGLPKVPASKKMEDL